MGGVLSYSGLSTKIRAMQSRLTTMDQFEEILQLTDVQQVAAYLKRMPEYSSKWNSLDETTLHRGQIEKLLKKSIFQDILDRGGFKAIDQIQHSGKVDVNPLANLSEEELRRLANGPRAT